MRAYEVAKEVPHRESVHGLRGKPLFFSLPPGRTYGLGKVKPDTNIAEDWRDEDSTKVLLVTTHS